MVGIEVIVISETLKRLFSTSLQHSLNVVVYEYFYEKDGEENTFLFFKTWGGLCIDIQYYQRRSKS